MLGLQYHNTSLDCGSYKLRVWWESRPTLECVLQSFILMPMHQQFWIMPAWGEFLCVFSQCPVEPCLWIPYDQFRLHSKTSGKLHIAAHVMCVFYSPSSRQTHNLQLPQSKLVLWYGEWQQLQTQHAGMAVYFWNLLALTYSFLSPHWGGIGLGLYIMIDHTHFLYCVQERTTCPRATLSLHWLPMQR